MNRRELFTAAAGAAALITATGVVHAAGEQDHSGHTAAAPGAPAATAYAKLVAAAGACGVTGQVCMSHCLNLIAAGDATLAACAKSVYQTTAACDALARLAAANSPHLAAYAKVCQAICTDCEKECRKHEKHHAECKACAESCAACAEECKKVAA